MHPRARHLTRGEQSGHRCTPVEIRFDAAHHVVRGRADRQQIAREIESGFQACCGNHRKPPVHVVCVKMAKAEKDRTADPPGLEHDAARDDVARREIGGGMVAEHERLPLAIHEPRALAAKGLREKEPRCVRHIEHGRMELHELHVGDARACAVRERDAITCRDFWIGGFRKHLARAACGQQRRARERAAGLAVRADEAHTQTAAVLDDGADRERVREHANPRDGGDTLPQHASDLAPRGVFRVQHAAHAVRALGCERGLAIGAASEAGAPLDELARVPRPFVAEHAHGALVAEPVARAQRVSGVQIRRVVFAERRGDAALRVLGVAFVRIGLRDDDDIPGRRQFNRRAKTRNPTADDYDVAAYIHL